MGEQAQKIGKKLEGFGEKLFSGFGWDELARDQEIECRRSNHNKRTHGLDLLMNFKNPYLGCKQGIIIECKNRQMKSITQDNLNVWVAELINTIECSQSAQELVEVKTDNMNLNTGLLLVHANDEFKKHLFDKYLSNLKVSNRRNPINIFVAGNEEIYRWNSLLNKIETIRSDDFQFIYPSIEGSNMEKGKYITINQLYSKYIFAQDLAMETKYKNGTSYKEPKKRKIMISFDEISRNCFKYMWSMFKEFQFQDAEEMVFIFYPRRKDDVEFIKENFIKTLYQIEPPIDADIENRIKIEFIDNRSLSPVDGGR